MCVACFGMLCEVTVACQLDGQCACAYVYDSLLPKDILCMAALQATVEILMLPRLHAGMATVTLKLPTTTSVPTTMPFPPSSSHLCRISLSLFTGRKSLTAAGE